MIRLLLPALASALLLAACDASDAPAKAPTAATEPGPAPTPAPAAEPVARDLSPPLLAPEAERGVKGARNILLSFARAIELRDYRQAWALLAPEDRERWSRAAFAALFSDLGEVTVAIPDGTLEGAAGSSYYRAPVTITGTGPQGRPVRIEGEAVLRRANDVDGATAADRLWHFATLELNASH